MQQYLKAIDNTEPSQVIRKVFPIPTTQIACSLMKPTSSLIRKEYITLLSISKSSTITTKQHQIILLCF